MDQHETLIRRFYAAFAARDGGAMADCYHRDLVFHDPAFGTLDAGRAAAMWQMLCARATDLHLTLGDVRVQGSTGSADWEARYTFSRTRRPVHNRIHATFQFRDGLIVVHTDHFDFWGWTRQALGLTGWLLGWSPWLRGRVQRTALAGLAEHQARSAVKGVMPAPS